jgi:hypothetical protein
MTSFAKYVVVLGASLIVATVSPVSADDSKPKKSKAPKGDQTPAPKQHFNIPVIKDHPSYKMFIPYFSSDGKRQMNFKIGVATRTGDSTVNMQDMHIETFDEHEGHEMDIVLPNSDFNTETNVVTTRHHVQIDRDDFRLTGDAMIFNTVTKQGGLAGNVRMVIYDMKSKTGRADEDAAAADAGAAGAKTPEPKKN